MCTATPYWQYSNGDRNLLVCTSCDLLQQETGQTDHRVGHRLVGQAQRCQRSSLVLRMAGLTEPPTGPVIYRCVSLLYCCSSFRCKDVWTSFLPAFVRGPDRLLKFRSLEEHRRKIGSSWSHERSSKDSRGISDGLVVFGAAALQYSATGMIFEMHR